MTHTRFRKTRFNNNIRKVFKFENLNPDYPEEQMKGLIGELKKPQVEQNQGYITEKVSNIKSHYNNALDNFRLRIRNKNLQEKFLNEVNKK